MLHIVLDWRKISKTILEKAFFFNLWRLYIYRFCVKKFEKWPF
jgi:hypothetical protein